MQLSITAYIFHVDSYENVYYASFQFYFDIKISFLQSEKYTLYCNTKYYNLLLARYSIQNSHFRHAVEVLQSN